MTKEDYSLLIWKKLEYKDVYFEDLDFETTELIDKTIDLAFDLYASSLQLENLKVNRFEVIDKIGKAYVKYCDRPLNIETSLQDNERTLKIFLDDQKAIIVQNLKLYDQFENQLVNITKFK